MLCDTKSFCSCSLLNANGEVVEQNNASRFFYLLWLGTEF